MGEQSSKSHFLLIFTSKDCIAMWVMRQRGISVRPCCEIIRTVFDGTLNLWENYKVLRKCGHIVHFEDNTGFLIYCFKQKKIVQPYFNYYIVLK